MVLGCEKQAEPRAHVGELPPMRPMAQLKPAQPARTPITAQPAEPVKAPTTEPVAVKPTREPRPLIEEPKAEAQTKPTLTYTIRKGDTLWSIAKKHLGSGTRWKEIVAVNPGLHPARLIPGRKIYLPTE